MGRDKIALLAFLFTGLGFVVAGGASGAGGDITQKPGAAGCYSPTADCMPAPPLLNAELVEISPDGKHVYIAGGDGVGIFDRDADGSLVSKPLPAGCAKLASLAPGTGCAPAEALSNPRGLAMSMDGKNLYAAGDYSIAIFDVIEDGSIVQKAGLAACISTASGCTPGHAMSGGFGGGRDLAIAPDDSQVFRTDGHYDALAIFARDEVGSLTQNTVGPGCFLLLTQAAPCASANGIDGARGVAVSPDGRSVYVASSESDSIAIFDRDANGHLAQKAGAAGCVAATSAGTCRTGRGLDGASSVAVSSDGKTVYVAGSTSDAIAIFNRSPNGALNQREGTAGCVAEAGAEGCAPGRALDGVYQVALSPDQANLYASSYLPTAVATFDRSPDGALVQHPGPAGCVTGTALEGCATGHEMHAISELEVSPDGTSLYATSTFKNSLLVFDREKPVPDTVAPALSSLNLSPSRFKAARKGPSITPSGKSRVSFRLSEAAKVVFTVERAAPGRRAGKLCVKQTKANRKKKGCTRFVRQPGSISRTGKTGANSFRFTGRLGGRTLKPGSYRLTARATDATGNRSRPVRKNFRIVARR